MSSTTVKVSLGEGAQSGLASLVAQYLEQTLAASEPKRRRARRLRGRVAVATSDHEVAATLDFRGPEIVVADGEEPPLDARVAAPTPVLLALVQGEGRPLRDHLCGRLAVRATLRRPLLPLCLGALVRLEPSRAERRRHRLLAAAGLLGAAAVVALYLGLRSE